MCLLIVPLVFTEISKTERSRKCREVLDTALYLIRFPAMTVQEFADTVATSGVLTLQETTDLFLHFTAKDKPSIGRFGASPRKGLPRQTCRRFASSHYRSNQWRYRGRTDSIQFAVDKRVFIIGFGLYGSSNGRYTCFHIFIINVFEFCDVQFTI